MKYRFKDLSFLTILILISALASLSVEHLEN